MSFLGAAGVLQVVLPLAAIMNGDDGAVGAFRIFLADAGADALGCSMF